MSQILDLREKRSPEDEAHKMAGEVKIISGQIETKDQPINKRLIATTSVCLALIGTAFVFWSANYITAAFFLLLAIVMLIIGFKKRISIGWELGRFGLTFDSFFYRYEDLKSFWIEYQPGYLKELSFQSRKWYHSYIKIPLKQENPLEIREFLQQRLPEERHEDTLIETISRGFGI